MKNSNVSNTGYLSNRMKRIELSKHAKKRCQQRGCSEQLLAHIKIYGDFSHDGHGAVRYTMTKNAMQRLHRSLGYVKALEKLEGMYMVISIEDGTVITVAHLQS